MTMKKNLIGSLVAVLTAFSLVACSNAPEEESASTASPLDIGTYQLDPIDPEVGVLSGSFDVVPIAKTPIVVWLMVDGQWVDAVVPEAIPGAGAGMARLAFAFQIRPDFLDGQKQASVYVATEPLPSLDLAGDAPDPNTPLVETNTCGAKAGTTCDKAGENKCNGFGPKTSDCAHCCGGKIDTTYREVNCFAPKVGPNQAGVSSCCTATCGAGETIMYNSGWYSKARGVASYPRDMSVRTSTRTTAQYCANGLNASSDTTFYARCYPWSE
jgi:hypothetical protein